MLKALKKIKNWGTKQIAKIKLLTKKETFVIALVLTFIPLVTHAFLATDVFVFFTSALEGIEELTLPFTAFFVFLIFGLLVSGLTLQLGVWLLKIASNPANLEIMNSEVVQAGWQFTSSIANTAIIIVLIVIGIATILNKESYSAKKTLPKLIIVALLVNFSLLFVGMIVDVANIILTTFFRADIGAELTKAIFTSWDSLFTELGIYISGLAGSFIVPFVAPVAQISMVLTATTLFLPTIISSIMQILIGTFIGIVLLTYGILFLARIFIIQILAILSPLAFVCWALPATEKLWKKWLNTLVGWSLLGAVLFFFLLLSTIAVAPLRPATQPSTIFNLEGLSSIFIYYIMLGVFLVVVEIATKSFMPEGAQTLVNQMGNAATGFKKQISKQTKPVRKRLKAKRDGATANELTDESIEEKEERYDQASGFAKLRTGFDLQTSKWSRRMSMTQGKSPESTVKESQKINKDIIKNASTEELDDMLDGKGLAGLKEHEKMPAIEELIDREDFDKVKGKIVKNWENLSDDLKDKLKQSHPDLHIDLANNEEEGIKNMKEETNKMSGSDVKKIKFDDIQIKYKGKIAAQVAKDPSKLQSLGSANITTKNDFLNALKESNDKQAIKGLGKYLSNPKNKEKWTEDQIKTARNIAGQHFNKKDGNNQSNTKESNDKHYKGKNDQPFTDKQGNPFNK